MNSLSEKFAFIIVLAKSTKFLNKNQGLTRKLSGLVINFKSKKNNL